MVLVEANKRGSLYALKLAYSQGDEPFYIQEDVHVIATMNAADRSLALVDYALRIRFAFIDIVPGFETPAFKEFLNIKGVSQGLIEKIIAFMGEVNDEIARDVVNLERGFEIGQS